MKQFKEMNDFYIMRGVKPGVLSMGVFNNGSSTLRSKKY